MKNSIEYDVFISYARKDYIDKNENIIPENPISKLTDSFDKNNITYWIDENGIYSGDRFAEEIAKNIRKSKAFLFVSSENSNVSEWTAGEVATARAYKKKIIPLKLDDSVYNDRIIMYLELLDSISYYKNADNAISAVIDAIKKCKEEFLEQEREAERIRTEEEQKRREKEEKEWLRKQQEAQKKEQERLEAIVNERKKREGQLERINSSIEELDTEVVRLEEEKIKHENEIRTIEHQLASIEKHRSSLEEKCALIEKELSSLIHGGPESPKHSPTPNDRIKHIQYLIRQNKAVLSATIAVILIVMGIVSIFNNLPTNSISDVDSEAAGIVRAIDSIKESEEKEEVVLPEPPKELEMIPVQQDTVYGIETYGRINWDNLHVLIDDGTNKLHKVSFAFIKMLEGLSDKNLNKDSGLNREDAFKAGIRVALYHMLNIDSVAENATGRAQAYKFQKFVGQLQKNELPPVLVVGEIKGRESCAIERCNEWIDIITRLYGVKPIVRIGKGNYNSDFKGKLHDCTLWMTDNDDVKITFKIMYDKSVKLYNGLVPYDNVFKNGRLSVYTGNYKEFVNYYKK